MSSITPGKRAKIGEDPKGKRIKREHGTTVAEMANAQRSRSDPRDQHSLQHSLSGSQHASDGTLKLSALEQAWIGILLTRPREARDYQGIIEAAAEQSRELETGESDAAFVSRLTQALSNRGASEEKVWDVGTDLWTQRGVEARKRTTTGHVLPSLPDSAGDRKFTVSGGTPSAAPTLSGPEASPPSHEPTVASSSSDAPRTSLKRDRSASHEGFANRKDTLPGPGFTCGRDLWNYYWARHKAEMPRGARGCGMSIWSTFSAELKQEWSSYRYKYLDGDVNVLNSKECRALMRRCLGLESRSHTEPVNSSASAQSRPTERAKTSTAEPLKPRRSFSSKRTSKIRKSSTPAPASTSAGQHSAPALQRYSDSINSRLLAASKLSAGQSRSSRRKGKEPARATQGGDAENDAFTGPYSDAESTRAAKSLQVSSQHPHPRKHSPPFVLIKQQEPLRAQASNSKATGLEQSYPSSDSESDDSSSDESSISSSDSDISDDSDGDAWYGKGTRDQAVATAHLKPRRGPKARSKQPKKEETPTHRAAEDSKTADHESSPEHSPQSVKADDMGPDMLGYSLPAPEPGKAEENISSRVPVGNVDVPCAVHPDRRSLLQFDDKEEDIKAPPPPSPHAPRKSQPKHRLPQAPQHTIPLSSTCNPETMPLTIEQPSRRRALTEPPPSFQRRSLVEQQSRKKRQPPKPQHTLVRQQPRVQEPRPAQQQPSAHPSGTHRPPHRPAVVASPSRPPRTTGGLLSSNVEPDSTWKPNNTLVLHSDDLQILQHHVEEASIRGACINLSNRITRRHPTITAVEKQGKFTLVTFAQDDIAPHLVSHDLIISLGFYGTVNNTCTFHLTACPRVPPKVFKATIPTRSRTTTKKAVIEQVFRTIIEEVGIPCHFKRNQQHANQWLFAFDQAPGWLGANFESRTVSPQVTVALTWQATGAETMLVTCPTCGKGHGILECPKYKCLEMQKLVSKCSLEVETGVEYSGRLLMMLGVGL